ncbi:MAG: tetratricopeptide repeat protein [Deltaproteobacteria bacterium]|nr:tetratricopeptide repeat protein [Deltaproteobacteria bacterium]
MGKVFILMVLFSVLSLYACDGDSGTAAQKKMSKANTKVQSGTEAQHQAARQQQAAEKLTMLTEELEAKPDDWEVLNTIGDVHFNMMRFKDAAEYYSKAAKINRTDVNLLNNLALSLHYIQRSDEGLTQINKAIKVDSKYQRGYLTKGFILATIIRSAETQELVDQRAKNIEAAKKAWQKAVDIDPESQIAGAARNFLEQYGSDQSN